MPDSQERMLSETTVERIFEIDSGHSPYLSKPKELADILDELGEEQ